MEGSCNKVAGNHKSWTVVKHLIATRRSIDGLQDVAVDARAEVWVRGDAVGLLLETPTDVIADGAADLPGGASDFIRGIEANPWLAVGPWDGDKPYELERLIMVPHPLVRQA